MIGPSLTFTILSFSEIEEEREAYDEVSQNHGECLDVIEALDNHVDAVSARLESTEYIQSAYASGHYQIVVESGLQAHELLDDHHHQQD